MAIAVEQDITVILNKLALVVRLPESLEALLVGRNVVIADLCLQVLSSLRAVVEGHFREELESCQVN